MFNNKSANRSRRVSMTGQELRAIRMLYGITQEQIADKLGYTTRDTIRKYENTDFLPNKFVIAISELVKIDFTNEKKLEDYIKKMPKEIFHKFKVSRGVSFF